MKDKILTTIAVIGIIAAIIFAIYGCYWVAKKLSYEWWYEPMVEQTIRDTVRPEYLK